MDGRPIDPIPPSNEVSEKPGTVHQEEGYMLRIVDGGYLLTENVPYVTAHGEVHEATLVMELTLSGDLTVPPTRHVAHWTGEFPHDASGNKLLAGH